jgi:hypothetical protein
MSYRNLPEDLLLGLNPSEVRRYAIAEGWQRVEGVNGKIALYQHPKSDLDQLIVPLDPSMDDYGTGMAEVITRLAERSGILPIQILDDLLDSPCDVMRFRLDEPHSRQGSIPLAQSISLLAAAERALLSAACSVIQPQTFHPRLSRAEAEQMVKACRVGQTERGSFVLKIACPLDSVDLETPISKPTPLLDKMAKPEPEPNLHDVNEPFTRKVTRLLMQSLGRIVTAIDSDKTDSLLVDQPGQPVLSANLCEALLAMQPTGDRSLLGVQTTWSRAFKTPPPNEVPGSVLLRADVFPEIEKIAQTLRPTKEPKVSTFVGLVDSLMGSPDPDRRVEGDVTFLLFDADETIKARATLNADDYHIAWQAHGAAGYVSLRGRLIRERRSNRIEEVSHLNSLST